MSIECQEIEYCKVKVNYVADPEIVKEKQNEAINQLKGMAVPGFRPGKATDQAIKSKFKNKIKDWVQREMITQAYDDILFETKMRPIGFPQTLGMQLDGLNFACEFLFLKKPDFELKEVKGLEIPKPHQEETEAEIAEKILQQLRVNNGEDIPYDDNCFVQIGDKITMDVKTIVDDELAEISTSEGQLYTVGDNFLPGFDDNILGMGAGEEREFELKLPDNFPTYSNKLALIKVKVHMGMRNHPCPLDDTLAEKAGFPNYDELRKVVDGEATRLFKQKQNQLIAEQVKKRLVSEHDFKVPEWLVSMEAQETSAKEGLKWDELTDEIREAYLSRANDNVKFSLILDSIRQNCPEAELTDSEVIQLLQQRILSFGVKDPNSILEQYRKNGQLIGMAASVRNEHAMQWIVNNVQLKE